MPRSKNQCYLMPMAAAVALAKTTIAGLKPVLALDRDRAPFTLLDCFDQPLRQSGRVLLETGTSFLLLSAKGRRLTQSAKRKGQFVADFRTGPVKQALADLPALRSLLPLASGTLRHGTLTLLDTDRRTRCRAELHVFDTSGQTGGAMVLLSGLHGGDKALAQLRRAVTASGGTVARKRSLHAQLFAGLVEDVVQPGPIVDPDRSAFHTATDIIADHIPVVRAAEGGIVADHDTEFLHDYRVALRKIRSVLSLFKGVYRARQTADLKDRFAALMAPTGRLRDLDVHLLQRQRYRDLLPEAQHGGLEAMFRIFAEERKVEQANLTRHLVSPAYKAQITSLATLFHKRRRLHPGPEADRAACAYACDLIWTRYRKISADAARIGPDVADAEVHRLRVRCKKLRYLIEFFGPLFPQSEVKALLIPLRQLQDTLGRFNDCCVQQTSLQDLLWNGHDLAEPVRTELAQAVGGVTAVLHLLQNEERKKVEAHFAQLNSPATRRAFRDLFHPEGRRR